ncbi:hypothetical protein [Nonomuraea sp. NEAU-A123]|uniref:hypothetical protein n=1 Tax=Nonomuraea sp. NEAU-A123 TaxID=2839649 RepID=UPI001BE41320|nr:hypothetical protein [Nonomuraea sp. NEAU-A123]MBT2228068.1 hypothetical protein [Nonomuraea sp. NEAU-A123]
MNIALGTIAKDTFAILDWFAKAGGSLQRLRTDYIPVYWSHIEDRSVPLELSAARGWLPYTCLQLRHTYLRPRPLTRLAEAGHVLATDETLEYVRAKPDVTLWAYNTLTAGACTQTDRPPEIYHHPGTTRRLAVPREVAAEVGAAC